MSSSSSSVSSSASNSIVPSGGKISFASDNASGAHEKVVEALLRANVGTAKGYGQDDWTIRAKKAFEREFARPYAEDFTDGTSVSAGVLGVHFVTGGTAANVLALGSVSTWFNSVLTSSVSHLNLDEGGSPERIFGLKVVPLSSVDGKIVPEQIVKHTLRFGDVHHSQPRCVSITQPTEYGCVYSREEVLAISSVCKQHGLLLHMDGARIANACAHLGLSLREATADLGVDMMSFGGTKNGALFGEAVLYFTPSLDTQFGHIQKQCMQMMSKNRFIAAQFEALLTDGLWWENASHANLMTNHLAKQLQRFPRIQFTHSVQSNAIFATIPKQYIDYLHQEFDFYVWDETINQVRLMTSFNTDPKHIQAFIDRLQEAEKLFGDGE